MRAQPDHKYTTVPADVLARLTGDDPKPAAPEVWRSETINRLSHAPLISTRVISSTVRMIEGLLVALAGALLAWYHPGYDTSEMTPFYVPLVVATSIALPLLAHAFGLYSMQSLLRPIESLPRTASAWTMIFVAIAVAVFLSKSGESYSRFWLASWFLLGLSLLVIERIVTAQVMRALEPQRPIVAPRGARRRRQARGRSSLGDQRHGEFRHRRRRHLR